MRNVVSLSPICLLAQSFLLYVSNLSSPLPLYIWVSSSTTCAEKSVCLEIVLGQLCTRQPFYAKPSSLCLGSETHIWDIDIISLTAPPLPTSPFGVNVYFVWLT